MSLGDAASDKRTGKKKKHRRDRMNCLKGHKNVGLKKDKNEVTTFEEQNTETSKAKQTQILTYESAYFFSV
jgi:hypothetical protein